MFARVRRFLAPPVFEDEEKTRVAGLLNIILIAIFVTTSLSAVAALFLVTTSAVSLIIGVALSLLYLGLWFLMRRGHVRLVGVLFSLTILAGITGALYSAGNAQAFLGAAYIICIVTASMLVSNRAAVVFTIASVLILLGLRQAEAAGLLPPRVEPDNVISFIEVVAIFGVTAVLIGMASRSITDALVRTRRSERELAERNRELAERTRELTERAQGLRLTANLSQRLATMRDLDLLLAQSVEQIREAFDLYYVQVYLADSTGRNLVLRAGTGEAGAALVRRGHALPIGPGSINGVAAATKKAVVVPDTTQSATFLPNPLLPDTRSEMAVPLVVGEQVVGVLNLQHDQPGALTDAILPIFETLAGQFAIAVDNANLFAEATQARAEVEAQLKWLARTGWQDFMDGIHRSERIGYTYERDTLSPIVEPLATTPAPHVLAVPIQVQKAYVGAIQIEGEANRAWTATETELVASVARQVAQHVENLRLLAQADRYRAEAEQATRRMTREGWQNYLAAKAESSTGFIYDHYEVRPLTGETTTVAEAGEPMLTQPLKVHDETIGQLVVGKIESLDNEVVELTTAVAERLSTHIESLRLFEETRTREHELEERSRELAASQRVTFAATETTDPDKLLDLVVNLIRDQFDLYHVQVYLVDEEKQAAVLHKSTGYAGQQLLEQGHQIPLTQSALVTKAIREGVPVVRNDVSTDKDWMPNPLLPHTSSELVLPLKAGGRMIGALDVQSRSRDFFSPRIVALFQTMAEQVAMNFRTIDLLNSTAEQAESLTRFATQLRTAAEIAQRMGTVLDTEQLLGQVVELLQSRLGLYHVHIYMVDEASRQLVMQAGSGEVGRVLRQRGHAIPLDVEKSMVARAAREKTMVVVNDTSLESDFLPNPLLPQTRSEIALPLLAGERVLGVLDVQDDQANRFTQADLDTFATLAGQISTALVNAGYVEQVETRLRVSQALAGARTEEEVLDVLIQQAGLYPQGAVVIQTFDPEAQEPTLITRRGAVFNSGLMLPPDGSRLTVLDFPLLQHISSDTPFMTANLLYDERIDPMVRGALNQMGLVSFAALPITAGTEWLGIVAVSSKEEGYFDERKLNLYRTLVEQGAVALRTAQLRDAVQRNLDETRVRFEVSQALAGAHTEEEVLDVLLQQAGMYPKTQVMLFTTEGMGEEMVVTLRRAASFESSLDSMVQPGTTFPMSQFALVMQHTGSGEFVSPNLPADERADPVARQMAAQMGTASMAVVPMLVENNVIGDIVVSSEQEAYFDERKLSLYRTLAEQGAVALRTARLYDETQKTAERLAEVDRLKSEFLASMSHELRTPLNSIIGYTEIMLMGIDAELDPELREDVQAIYDNGQHLLRIINDVLDLAKIEAGRLTLNMEEVQIQSVVDAAASSVAGLLVNKPVEFRVEADGDLPVVWGDQVRLNQILNNLISNAVKFTDEGHITLRAFSDDGGVCLEVEDTGIGISEADQRKLFERFQQIEGSNARKREGTGLGLAITRHLVNLHGGTIAVKSRVGEGSTFTVRLPIHAPAASSAASAQGERAAVGEVTVAAPVETPATTKPSARTKRTPAKAGKG